jgi:hypothetical protein
VTAPVGESLHRIGVASLRPLENKPSEIVLSYRNICFAISGPKSIDVIGEVTTNEICWYEEQYIYYMGVCSEISQTQCFSFTHQQ